MTKLAQAAGLGGVVLRWGEESSQDPASPPAPATTITFSGKREMEPWQSHWPVATIEFNPGTLRSRVNSDRMRHPDLSDQEAWMRRLDLSLRLSMVAAANQVLVEGPVAARLARIRRVSWAPLLLGAAANIVSLKTMALFAAAGHLDSYRQVRDYRRVSGDHTSNKPVRVSLLPYGLQPDRLAVAAGMSLAWKLFRPIPQEQSS